MIERPPTVTIFGGSGFVGRYIVRRMAKRGWRVRVAVRHPNDALFVKTYGVVGQVVPMQANIRDDATTRMAIEGVEAVVNCIGVLFEDGRNTFQATQAEGAGRVARVAAECGVKRLVHVSAIGADAESPSAYARTKAAGEANMRAGFPEAVILRPSIVFGAEDGFFNRFAAMARLSPVLPVIGAGTRFQPVYVDDVAEAAARAAAGEAAGGAAYELGGPQVATFETLMRLMLAMIKRRRLLLRLPFRLGEMQGWFLEKSTWIGIEPLITVDQVKLLRRDNVVAEGAKTLEDLGIEPTAMQSVLESYLYAYRPRGQYHRITGDLEA